MVQFIDPTLGGRSNNQDFGVGWVGTQILLKLSDSFMVRNYPEYIRGVRALFNLLSGKVERNKQTRDSIKKLDEEYETKMKEAKGDNDIKDLDFEKAELLQRILMGLIEVGQEEEIYEA